MRHSSKARALMPRTSASVSAWRKSTFERVRILRQRVDTPRDDEPYRMPRARKGLARFHDGDAMGFFGRYAGICYVQEFHIKCDRARECS